MQKLIRKYFGLLAVLPILICIPVYSLLYDYEYCCGLRYPEDESKYTYCVDLVGEDNMGHDGKDCFVHGRFQLLLAMPVYLIYLLILLELKKKTLSTGPAEII